MLKVIQCFLGSCLRRAISVSKGVFVADQDPSTTTNPMLSDSDGGGVNYTAIVELQGLDPAIRWGMTAFVDIEAGS